jgi:hypothetical protein
LNFCERRIASRAGLQMQSGAVSSFQPAGLRCLEHFSMRTAETTALTL